MVYDKCRCEKTHPDPVSGRCFTCDRYYRPDELPYEVVHPENHGDYNTLDPTMTPDTLDPTGMSL